jgi:hypothetical protein
MLSLGEVRLSSEVQTSNLHRNHLQPVCLSEQANHWMGNTIRRAKPLDAFYLYFHKLGKLFSDRRQAAAGWLRLREPDVLVSTQQKKMAERAEASKTCGRVAHGRGVFCSVSGRTSSGWLRLSVATRQLAGQRMHACELARRGVFLYPCYSVY